MAFTLLNLYAFTQALALAIIGGALRRLFVLKIHSVGQYAKLIGLMVFGSNLMNLQQVDSISSTELTKANLKKYIVEQLSQEPEVEKVIIFGSFLNQMHLMTLISLSSKIVVKLT